MSARPWTCRGCDRPLRTRHEDIPEALEHRSHGMCDACWRAELGQSERTWQGHAREVPREQVLEEWAWLRRSTTYDVIAQRLGMKPRTFERALDRAQAAGDPRAVGWRKAA